MSRQFYRLFGDISKTGQISVLQCMNLEVKLPCNNVRLFRLFTQVPSGRIACANTADRFYSTTVSDSKISLIDKARQEKDKKKKHEPPKVVLISENKSISVVTLEEAGKLAKKKNLHLIEVENSSEGLKTEKQVYKLVSSSQFYGEDWKSIKGAAGDGKQKENKEKEEKTLMLKSKTSEHDVLIKVKNVKKLVEKGHTVKVFIGQAGAQGQNPEAVYKIMEDALKDEPVRIIQKINKNSQIRFQVMPLKKEKTTAVDEKKSKNKPLEVTVKGDDDATEAQPAKQ